MYHVSRRKSVYRWTKRLRHCPAALSLAPPFLLPSFRGISLDTSGKRTNVLEERLNAPVYAPADSFFFFFRTRSYGRHKRRPSIILWLSYTLSSRMFPDAVNRCLRLRIFQVFLTCTEPSGEKIPLASCVYTISRYILCPFFET